MPKDRNNPNRFKNRYYKPKGISISVVLIEIKLGMLLNNLLYKRDNNS